MAHPRDEINARARGLDAKTRVGRGEDGDSELSTDWDQICTDEDGDFAEGNEENEGPEDGDAVWGQTAWYAS